MKQVKLAAIVAAILVTFSVGALAQDTILGHGTLQPAPTTGAPTGQTPGEQGMNTVKQVYSPPAATTAQLTPAPSTSNTPSLTKKPVVSTPRWQTREGIEEATRRVLGGRSPQRGLRGPQGMTGRPGKDHVPGHGNVLSILHGQDSKGRHWNVVSGTYVDARDQATLEKAKKYTQGYVDGSQPKMQKATSSQSRDSSWMLWWLLPLLFLLTMLLVSLAAPFGGLRNFWNGMSWFKPKQKQESEPEPVKPIKPDITNTDNGDYFGYDAGPAHVALTCDGTTVIKKWKGYADCSIGDGSFRWAAADETIEGKFKVGSKLAFALSRENTGNTPVSTEGVIIKDDFQTISFGRFVPGSGNLVISGKKVADLDDELIRRIISGATVRLDEVIDEIPANSSVNIVYFVKCLPKSGHGAGPTDAPRPDGDAEKPPLFKLATISKPAAVAEPEPQAEPQTAPAEPKPKSEETKTEMISRLRKEILRGDYKLPEEFEKYLEDLPNEDEIRQRIVQYYHTCGILLRIDKDAGKRSYRPKLNRLASEIAMDKAKLDEVEREYRSEAVATEEKTDVGTVEDATAGLLEGLRGEEENEEQ